MIRNTSARKRIQMAGRRFKLASLLLAIALFFSSTVAQAQTTNVPVIVKVAPLSTIQRVLNTLIGGKIIDSIPGADIYLVNVPNVPLVQSLLATPTLLLQLLGIDWLEINTGVAQPGHLIGGILTTTGSADWYKDQPSFALIRSGAAKRYSTGRGVVVADINSRVDVGHPALLGHLTGGYDFVTNKPIGETALNQSDASFLDQSDASFLDQSDASFLDQSDASFLDQSDASFLDSSANPAYSHGTLCAGVIAAIAPDAMIMPLRGFDDRGSADLFLLAKAIRYAADHGAQVINMSFGTLDNSKALKNSTDYAKGKNIIMVASAGNKNTSTPQYPAAFSGVLTVAATDIFDKKAPFSNYGSYVFVDGPGVNLFLPYPNGYYAMVSGTSFSAPEVAATAALIRSLRSYGIAASISNAAVDIDSKNPAYTDKLGYGRIDVLKAVKPY
jgi:subtilisin family serine protease